MRKKIVPFILLFLVVLFLLPVVLTVISSFTAQPNLERSVDLIPKGFTIIGYYRLFIESTWYLKGFWNSIFYALVITAFNLVIAIPAAYAFQESMFRGKKLLYFLYIVLMLMPLQVTILPNYIGLRDMNLINTPWAIILPGIFSPFGVFLLYQYMQGIEKSTIESARLETNSIVQIIQFIVLPQVKTCILALFVFIFAENWNLVEQPNVYLKDIDKMPLSVLLAMDMGYEAMTLFSGSVLFMIPVVILYLYFHESLEVGLENLKL